jgi:two-component sensor histidine kinase
MSSPSDTAATVPDVAFIAPRNQGIESTDDSGLILREIHHRMKNTLSLLTAWVRVDFGSFQSLDVRKAIDRFERRVLAFDELYRLLSVGAGPSDISVGGSDISVGGYVESLSRALTVAILEPVGLSCDATIEDGLLETARCERLGLIITELVTNAAKHAFPNRQEGLVRINTNHGQGVWLCTVSDNGEGANGASPGDGARIIEDLARSIQARVSSESGPHGTAVTIILPCQAIDERSGH